VCRHLDFPVILLGGVDDEMRGNAIVAQTGGRVMNGCGLYSLNQLAVLIREAHSRKTLRGWLQWRRIQLTSYAIMYPALLLPDTWFSVIELIPTTQLDKIRDYFADDWDQCRAYARRYNLS